MGCVSREAALSPRSVRVVRVDVPEWGDGAHVFVRVLTGTERDAWEVYSVEQQRLYRSEVGYPGFRAALLVRCLCDEKGERIFLDTDVEELGKQPASVVSRLFDAAHKLNGISKSDVEELQKNS